jgi:hypothetical protein
VRASKLHIAFAVTLSFMLSISIVQAQASTPAGPIPSAAPPNPSSAPPVVVAPGWIAIEDARLREHLPRWPEPSSLQGRADVWAALLAQSQRTPQHATEAEANATRRPFDWAATALQGTSLATRFTTGSAPATASLLTRLQADGRELINNRGQTTISHNKSPYRGSFSSARSTGRPAAARVTRLPKAWAICA